MDHGKGNPIKKKRKTEIEWSNKRTTPASIRTFDSKPKLPWFFGVWINDTWPLPGKKLFSGFSAYILASIEWPIYFFTKKVFHKKVEREFH